MNEMNVSSAKYYKMEGASENEGIIATINGVEMHIPISTGNSEYVEIMRQVDAGTLTFEETVVFTP